MLNVDPCGELNILEQLRVSGVLMESPCNGKGMCGKCKVRVINGEASALTEREITCLTAEEISKGVRLACQAVPKEPLLLDPLGLLEEQEGRVLGSSRIPDVVFAPAVTAKLTEVGTPDLENGWTLCDSLGDVLKGIKQIPLSLMRKLPGLMGLRSLWSICYDGIPVDLRKDSQRYGLAVDIGTTTVALVLVDLSSGEVLGEDGFINPQKAFGLDVLSRIHYDIEHSDGVKDLQNAIVRHLQNGAGKMAARAGIPIDAIYEIVVGGNSTMLHALLGVPLQSLGISPYSSVFTQPMTVSARELGFDLNPEGKVYCIPAVSTYIGGDIVAGVLVSRIDEAQDTVLLVDIGTNGEIVLSRQGRMYACSCAAGPALEGMNISCGMRAEDGAVERVVLGNGHVTLGVIGGGTPRGLCGSGLLEAVSQAATTGLINKSGRISADSLFTDIDEKGKRRIVLDRKHGIYLTQNDIRQVQFCKGAILSGILTLLDRLSLEPQDIDRVIVAGQFGKHLEPESLTGAGLIPAVLRDRISYVGNSSMAGAQMCLLSMDERKRAEHIAQNIEYIELSVSDGYEKRFTRCLQLGGT